MSTLFISDLHLSPSNPELIQTTVDFLAQHASKIDQLYILGDLFNTWLGDDIVPDEFQPLIEQLTKLKQVGIKCYLMVGNRDFMLGKGFADSSGMNLLQEPTLIELGQCKGILVSHQKFKELEKVDMDGDKSWLQIKKNSDSVLKFIQIRY